MYNYVLLYFRVRFAIGVDHVDYVTIKKRIQVCTSITPTLDKLIDRYFTLYKKWSNQRFVYIFDLYLLVVVAVEVLAVEVCECCTADCH